MRSRHTALGALTILLLLGTVPAAWGQTGDIADTVTTLHLDTVVGPHDDQPAT